MITYYLEGQKLYRIILEDLIGASEYTIAAASWTRAWPAGIEMRTLHQDPPNESTLPGGAGRPAAPP